EYADRRSSGRRILISQFSTLNFLMARSCLPGRTRPRGGRHRRAPATRPRRSDRAAPRGDGGALRDGFETPHPRAAECRASPLRPPPSIRPRPPEHRGFRLFFHGTAETASVLPPGEGSCRHTFRFRQKSAHAPRAWAPFSCLRSSLLKVCSRLLQSCARPRK